MEYEIKFSGPSSHGDPQLLTGRDSEEKEWPPNAENQSLKNSFSYAWLLETMFHEAQVNLELPMYLSTNLNFLPKSPRMCGTKPG